MAGFLSEERPIRTLREVMHRLRESYCGTIGYEVRHICQGFLTGSGLQATCGNPLWTYLTCHTLGVFFADRDQSVRIIAEFADGMMEQTVN